jgi:hypothetical protein
MKRMLVVVACALLCGCGVFEADPKPGEVWCYWYQPGEAGDPWREPGHETCTRVLEVRDGWVRFTTSSRSVLQFKQMFDKKPGLPEGDTKP